MPTTHPIDTTAPGWHTCPACRKRYHCAQFVRVKGRGFDACRFCFPPPRLAPAVAFGSGRKFWFEERGNATP